MLINKIINFIKKGYSSLKVETHKNLLQQFLFLPVKFYKYLKIKLIDSCN